MIFSGCLGSWEVALATNGGFSGTHSFFLCLHIAVIQHKNQVLALHISQSPKSDQQRALVRPQMEKSHVFGYPVTNGLEKLLREALNNRGNCEEGSWNQVFSTFFIPFGVPAADPC